VNQKKYKMKQLTATALFKIKEGKLEEFKQFIPSLISAVKEKDPGTLTYDWYLNEDNMECVVLETYSDSQAVLAHSGNVGELLQKILEVADLSLQLYGNPSEELKNAIVGMDVKIYPFHSGL
jgi:quinol monooxygenase YgiN